MDKLKGMVFYFIVALILAGAAGFFPLYPSLDVPSRALAADEEKKDPAGEEAQPCPECPDPAKVVLRGLEEKKQVIAAETQRLEQERKELETYEAQVDEKLTALAALKKQIRDDMAVLEQKKTGQEAAEEAAFEAKMARLVKMYAGMKPKAAALIIDKIELDVAQEIFLRMREASASQILAFVDSAKAAKISERLAFKKN